MGLLLIVSIAAMTSFMTMVQLIALTLTTTQSPAVQAKVGPQRIESVATKIHTKKNAKVRRTANHHTRSNGPHSAHVAKRNHATILH
jgi:hypothetical protein